MGAYYRRNIMLKKNDIIIFQGDSITDANKRIGGDWFGYAGMVPKILNAFYPDYNLTFYNMGIGGNSVLDIRDRWQKDCLDLKPSIVTLLAGINGVNCDANVFRETYKYLITSVKKTGAKFIAMEPFFTKGEMSDDSWFLPLSEKLFIIRDLAEKHADALIPLNGLFAKMCAKYGAEYCTQDGVHPTIEGQRLIAKEVIKCLTKEI